MLAALQSWALGAALTLGPATERPVEVTLVATDAQADHVARLLAPRLAEAGFHAELRRCEDFGCVRAPRPGDAPEVIVVVSNDTDDTLVIVTLETPEGLVVVMDEVPVAMPRSTLDGEVLGFAVIRDLTDPPLERRITWNEAKQHGLDRAPPPPLAAEPEPETEPETEDGTTRPRPYLQAGLGGALALPFFYERREVMGGIALTAEAGAVWNPLRKLRMSVGGAVAQTQYGSALAQANTDVLAKLRLGVGTSKVWGYGIVGGGLSFVIRDEPLYRDLHAGPSALVGLGVRGTVAQRVSVGFDVESTIVGIPPIGRVTRVSGLLVVAVQLGK